MKLNSQDNDHLYLGEDESAPKTRLVLRNRFPVMRMPSCAGNGSDNDENSGEEKRALKRIALFFAIMVILTLVARGTSSAILPTVTTEQARAGTIRQSIQTTGAIKTSGSVSVSLPEGVRLGSILVKEGQTVEEGQALATFDLDDLSAALERAKASLNKSQAEYNQLVSSAIVDDTSVERAQQALLRAYEADEKAYNELQKLRADADTEENAEAIKAAEEAAEEAHWAAQQAEYDRDSAVAAYQESVRQNDLTNKVNQASAQDIAINIEEKKNEIAQLEELIENEGVVYSPFSGIIATIDAEAGKDSTATLCSLYDTSKGYLFICAVPSSEARDCATGLSATITQDDKTENAVITAVSENAEDDTIEITIQLNSENWKIGSAKAEIVLSEKDYEYCLPNTAIHEDNQGKFVFLVEEKNTVLGTQSVLTRVSVDVLESGRSQSAVEGAISSQDTIVAESTRPLEAGSKVRVSNGNE